MVFTVGGEEIGVAALEADPVVGVAHATYRGHVPAGGMREIRASYAGDQAHGAAARDYLRWDPVMTAEVVSRLRPNAAGWYRTPVTVSFACTEGSAHVVDDVCPRGLSRRNTGRGFLLSRTVDTVDGGRFRFTERLRVDTRGPVMTARRVPGSAFESTRPVRCHAADGRSGLAGACRVRYGRLVEGPRGGLRRAWTAVATDRAGNTTTRSGGFVVRR